MSRASDPAFSALTTTTILQTMQRWLKSETAVSREVTDQPPVPLGAGTEQTCLLLLADFYQCFPVELSDGGKVHVYHVIPLYTEERDFEKAHGMQPLLEAMAAQGLESLVVRPDRGRFVA